MIYKFRCDDSDCGVVEEKVMTIADFEKLWDASPVVGKVFGKCPKCGGRSEQQMDGAPAVMTSGMSQAPLDVVIGRDAEKRWKNINQRQDKRDKVRREAGKTGLTQTGYNEFQPLSDEKKAKRTEGMRAVEKEGFKPLVD